MACPIHTLGREERLKSRTRIARLFAEGKGGLVYPIRYILLEEEPAGFRPGEAKEYAAAKSSPVSVLISVPKRHHKRAVKRNLLKRRIREAYRLNKEALLTARASHEGKILSLGLLYIAPEVVDYQEIENAVKKILDKLAQRN